MEANVEAFRLQVEKILSSDTFRNAESLRKLLRFLAEKAATGEADNLKEYSLGIDALGKPTTYDPRSDATVRIQVGRLRQKLAEYHAEEGKLDEWVVTLPKGRFRLVCDPRTEAPAVVEVPVVEVPRRTISWAFVAALVIAVVSSAWAIAVTVSRSRLADQTAGYRALWTSEMEDLWKPFLGTSKPVVVSIADPPFAQFGGGGAYRELTLKDRKSVV